MRIKFIKDFLTHYKDIKIGEIHEVVLKKEPDKFRGYSEYRIQVKKDGNANIFLNVPEMFVEEISRKIA